MKEKEGMNEKNRAANRKGKDVLGFF